MSKERYQKNRERVYEIYGIDIKDRNYNCHHIVFKEDVRRGHVDTNVDDKGNLIPMRKDEHARLHEKINKNEVEVYDSRKYRKRKRRKR